MEKESKTGTQRVLSEEEIKDLTREKQSLTATEKGEGKTLTGMTQKEIMVDIMLKKHGKLKADMFPKLPEDYSEKNHEAPISSAESRALQSFIEPNTTPPKSLQAIKDEAESYICNQHIDYGDLNEQAENQIKNAFIAGANYASSLSATGEKDNGETLVRSSDYAELQAENEGLKDALKSFLIDFNNPNITPNFNHYHAGKFESILNNGALPSAPKQ